MKSEPRRSPASYETRRVNKRPAAWWGSEGDGDPILICWNGKACTVRICLVETQNRKKGLVLFGQEREAADAGNEKRIPRGHAGIIDSILSQPLLNRYVQRMYVL